jgi:hypothetical protein
VSRARKILSLIAACLLTGGAGFGFLYLLLFAERVPKGFLVLPGLAALAFVGIMWIYEDHWPGNSL